MEISIEVLIADSRLAFVQGRFNESLKLADEALKVDENNSDAHQCAGNAYMSKQDYDNAIEHYKLQLKMMLIMVIGILTLVMHMPHLINRLKH